MNFIAEVEYIEWNDSVGRQVIERAIFREQTFGDLCDRLRKHERLNITRVVIRSEVV